MEKENMRDIKIAGTGDINGGSYREVNINGYGRAYDDMECIKLSVNGTGSMKGNVTAEKARINGSCTIEGNLKGEELRVNGRGHIGKDAEVKEVRIDGTASINGNLQCEKIETRGEVKVEGNCEAENFISKGSFNVGGLLNAGNIEVELYGTCKAREIGGENISVKMGNGFSFRKIINSILPTLGLDGGLITDVIEGDNIFLEYTKAKVVRGNTVTIGAECQIDLVEYKTGLEVVGNAVVKENKKM